MKIRVFLVILGFCGCALKMPPPSPDRFPPKLEEVEVLNRTKINLKFNEDIDSKTVIKDSILITVVNDETLSIKEITSGRKASIVTLITNRQSPVRYSVFTQVSDIAGNRAKVRAQFLGSTEKDTIPPRILKINPKAGAIRQIKNVRVELNFSEEIDTIAPLSWIVLPKDLKSRFSTFWQPDHKQLVLSLSDSLGPDTVVYFVFLRTVFDFEGNRLKALDFNFFTSDSLLNTKMVTGKVFKQNKPLADGLVIFARSTDSLKSMALIPTDTAGAFALQIREGIYNIFAVADTNFDGRVDLSGEIRSFNTANEKIEIEVYPDSVAHNLDWYLR